LVASRVDADLFGDGPLLLAAFERVGVEAVVVPWGSASSGWDAFDAVVVRGTWDYIDARDEFLAWAASVPAGRLANSLEVLRWNTDKRYLRELEAAGIPVVPTQWSDQAGWSFPDREFVVKPAVSAGARNSARYRAGDQRDDAAAHVAAIQAAGEVAMIQPFVASVESEGETGTYVFGGSVSHAIRKGSVLRPDVPATASINDNSIDAVSARTVDPELAAFALDVLAVAPGPCLYARVDTVPDDDGRPLLIELEVTEPFLFLDRAPGAADRFAAATLAFFER
jgi:hypothetical protein